MKISVLLLFATAALADDSEVKPYSSDYRVRITCMTREVEMRFSPLESYQGKLAVEMNMTMPGCFKSNLPGREVVLVVNFKQCTNKARKFIVRLIEKYKGSKTDPDYKYKRGIHTTAVQITCPPFPKIPFNTHFHECPGYIERVNGYPTCFETE